MVQKAQLGGAHHGVIAGVPHGEAGCPDDRVDTQRSETKTTGYEGTLGGKVGIELEERDRVEVTDLRLQDGAQTINFGDLRVVEALGGPERCHYERQSVTHLEIPYEIRKNGTLAIDLSAFTEVIGRVRSLSVDNEGFGTTAPQPPVNPPAPPPV